MTFNRLLPAFTAVSFIVSARAAAAQQPIRVALMVEEQASGLVQSIIGSSLRSLGDVTVVTPLEDSALIVAVASYCLVPTNSSASESGGCPDGSFHATSIQLLKPFSGTDFVFILADFDSAAAESITGQQTAELDRALRSFVRPLQTWIIGALQGGLRSQLSGVVAQIDSRCLESMRLSKRAALALLSGDRDTATLLQRQIANRSDWLC